MLRRLSPSMFLLCLDLTPNPLLLCLLSEAIELLSLRWSHLLEENSLLVGHEFRVGNVHWDSWLLLLLLMRRLLLMVLYLLAASRRRSNPENGVLTREALLLLLLLSSWHLARVPNVGVLSIALSAARSSCELSILLRIVLPTHLLCLPKALGKVCLLNWTQALIDLQGIVGLLRRS
jgi:hypothetical protein